MTEWTTKEEDNVMAFYGMDNLYTERWNSPPETMNFYEASMSAIAPAGLFREFSPLPDAINSNNGNGTSALLPKDPLGLKGSYLKDIALSSSEDPSLIDVLNIHSPKFDAKTFLRRVHATTSFSALSDGRSHLRSEIDSLNNTLKDLVKRNFDRFVHAKNIIDSVYIDLKKKAFGSDDYGTINALKAIESSYALTLKIFGPILERVEKEERTKEKLMLLNKYKSVFGLSSLIKDAMQRGDYEAAIHDYKKAKALVADSTATFSFTSSDNPSPLSNQTSTTQIFANVWKTVSAQVNELRDKLIAILKNPEWPIEQREKIINYLGELDAPLNPVSLHIDTLKATAMKQFDTHIKDHISILSAKAKEENITDTSSERSFERALMIIQRKAFEQLGNIESVDAFIWLLKLTIIKQLALTFAKFLSDLARLNHGVVHAGKYIQRGTSPKDTLIILKNTVCEMSEQFSSQVGDVLKTGPLIDLLNQNALLASHFGCKIVTIFIDLIESIKGLKLPNDWLVSLLAHTTEHQKLFIDLVWHSFINECKHFHIYGHVIHSVHAASFKIAQLFHHTFVYVLKSSAFIAQDIQVGGGEKEEGIRGDVEAWTRHAFLSFLDALKEMSEESGGDEGRLLKIKPLLLTLSNVRRFNTKYLPQDIGLFEELFDAALDEEVCRNIAMSTIRLQDSLTDDYVRANMNVLTSTLYEGIAIPVAASTTAGSSSTSISSLPQEIRPYIYATLTNLVFVYKEISDISTELLEILLQKFIANCISHFLTCVRDLPNDEPLSVRAYLQFIVERDFMEAVLSDYLTPKSRDAFTLIDSALGDLLAENENISESQQSYCERLVSECEKSTCVQFKCFKKRLQ